MVALGDTLPLGADVMEAVKQVRRCSHGRRPHAACHRSLRSVCAVLSAPVQRRIQAVQGLPKLGKAHSRMAGQEGARRRRHQVPDGDLARTVDEAAAVAKRTASVAIRRRPQRCCKTEAGGSC
jgi:hypothetical protein